MDLFKLFGTIAIDNTNANQGIDETTDKAEKSHPKISAAFEKIGDAAVKVGKVVATGLAAGSAAIGALAKQSLDSYADYEQLVGGVETLFTTSADKVQEYAASAFKTAGLSANEYMETVTSFSASLLQSLGGDTAAAADMANQAITDMSDNANKMGSDMSAIQNAYQGFAKQNYSMLDNLKLGYGGTQAEMYRLLQDAAKLDSTFAQTAQFSLDELGHLTVGFSDVVQAIHIVQSEMGITGTTAQEAGSTIQGSLSAAKSAWQNLLTGFAGGGESLKVLIANLVESVTTAAQNIVPRIMQILSGITEALPQVIAVLTAELPGMMETMLPGLISGATALITGLVGMLPQIMQILLAQVPNTVKQLAEALIAAFPALLETVKNLFGQIWDYISLELLNTGVSFEDAFAKIQVVFETVWMVLQTLWNTIGQPIFSLIQSAVGIIRDAFAERMPQIKEFVSTCFGDIKKFWNNNLKPCLDAIKNFIQNVLAPAFEKVFKNVIGKVVDDVFGTIKNLWNNSLKPIFTGITDFLTGVFTGNWRKAWNGIKSIFSGIWEGIKTAFKLPINWVIDGINAFIRGINKIKIPDWVPLVGGKGFSIAEIPRLEKGGILEKGQVGLLEGNGAEAVVPLDQNQAWIKAVAQDMQTAIGGNSNQDIKELKEAFQDFVQNLPEMMLDAFASMKFDVNNREFARMVKAVN